MMHNMHAQNLLIWFILRKVRNYPLRYCSFYEQQLLCVALRYNLNCMGSIHAELYIHIIVIVNDPRVS
jgi:hypothetical protein